MYIISKIIKMKNKILSFLSVFSFHEIIIKIVYKYIIELFGFFFNLLEK